MHFAYLTSLLAIGANVALANVDATIPSISVERADKTAVPQLRSGFSERRVAMMELQPRADQQGHCNKAVGFFSTARCALRRSKVKPGTAVTFAAETVNKVVTDIWEKITTTSETTGMLMSNDYADGKLYIYASAGLAGYPASSTWPSLNQGVPTYDLYIALQQAVYDCQSSGGVGRYYLTSSSGEIYASLIVKAAG
ncbi:hypothetical protein F4821DRAFT_228893 [Hypoxylon rubiginosum]|uniref:Uncharacterized protein n=1 Tax=Hypoxylon rubiginosum TaxID=110542 RepID=A0ACC0DD76_9PEZI|nr:hypothetical protein F4821DRAFT_228893 [Hypoxylon rubiginosum]